MADKLLFAVIGDPIAHSKSPDIWNHAFKHLGIDARYFRIHVPKIEYITKIIKEIGLNGLNITSPHKDKILSYLDYIEDDAFEIGSINTVAHINGGLRGYNTDYTGVVDSLTSNGVCFSNSKVVVIGSGGAAKAALFALKKAGIKDLLITNRTYTKALELSEQFFCRACKLEDLQREMLNTNILISCISASERVVPKECLHKNLVVFNADYSKQSMLFNDVMNNGCKLYITGTEWLLYQAVHSFLHFFETNPVMHMREALIRSIERMSYTPKSISLVGFMGSGKSAVGARLADMLNFEFVETDKLIEQKESCSINEIFEKKGEEYFRKIETEVLKSIDFASPKVVSCGGGIVINEENRKFLKDFTTVVWLWSSLEFILKRTENTNRPLLMGTNRERKAELLLKERNAYYADSADVCFVNLGQTINEIAESIADEIY